MSISREVPELSPVGAVAEVVVALRALAETLWSARTDDELVGVVEQVQQASAVLAAVEAAALAEVDARDVARQSLHYGSTGDWLTHVGGLHRGEGKRRVVRARALTGPLARTRRSLVTGDVSPQQAEVIVRSVDDLPSSERVIDHAPWEIRLNPRDRRPEFLPPPKPGSPHALIRGRPRRT